MKLEELRKIHPLTVKEVTCVEDINALIVMRKQNSQKDFKFFYYLAAHYGGVYQKDRGKFLIYYECDLDARTIKPARLRISDHITEDSIIRNKKMIYLSGWNKSEVERKFQSIQIEK